MSKRRLESDEDGRIVFKSDELEEIAGDVNALQCDLKEIAESIRTVNDTFCKLIDRMDNQHQALLAIASTIILEPKEPITIDHLTNRNMAIKAALDL